MLRVDLRPGEGVEIDGGRIVVRVEQKNGQATRLAIDAAREIDIRVIENAAPPSPVRNGLTRV